jgi:hypothetical protein
MVLLQVSRLATVRWTHVTDNIEGAKDTTPAFPLLDYQSPSQHAFRVGLPSSQPNGDKHHPHLAPAAPIETSRRNRRSSSQRDPPSLLSTHHGGKSRSDLGPGARYPSTPRAGILRMPSQQAEKDAVDTLLFMSSPNNSAYSAPTAHPTAQPSPLRTAFPPAQLPKRVVFENSLYPQQHQPTVTDPAMRPLSSDMHGSPARSRIEHRTAFQEAS